jgi:acetate kinase
MDIAKSDLNLIGGIINATEAITNGRPLAAVVHRVVHGGRQFEKVVQINDFVISEIQNLGQFAPLHQPHNLLGIRAVEFAAPLLPQFAGFDTAFHRSQPIERRRYALPEEFFVNGIERYGFHGLSYSWLMRAIHQLRGDLPARILALHLGSGSSACAILKGKSVATSMGFSPLDGLIMGTRPGSIDPGVLLHLIEKGMGALELSEIFYMKSGLQGISGHTSDMRALLKSDDPAASLAVAMYCNQAASIAASMIPEMSGVDAIIFTGGIGENSSLIREEVCRGLEWAGIVLDPAANGTARGESPIHATSSKTQVWILPTNEEIVVARQARELLGNEATT